MRSTNPGRYLIFFLIKFPVECRQNYVWRPIFDSSYDHIHKNINFCKGKGRERKGRKGTEVKGREGSEGKEGRKEGKEEGREEGRKGGRKGGKNLEQQRERRELRGRNGKEET